MTDAERATDADVDFALLAQWQAGNQRAATALVERHAPALARFAISLGVRDQVDELVQDTFVRAFGALQSFRGDSALRTWLFTIQRRLVLDRRRSARRAPESVDIDEHEVATPGHALDRVVADETERRVWEAMARLSPMQRDVFTLRVQEGRSYRDIAEILGSTEGAARVHYHNALRAVKEWLHD